MLFLELFCRPFTAHAQQSHASSTYVTFEGPLVSVDLVPLVDVLQQQCISLRSRFTNKDTRADTARGQRLAYTVEHVPDVVVNACGGVGCGTRMM